MKNVLTLFELGLAGLILATSVINPGIHKKNISVRKTALIISNKEMKDIMTVINFFEDSGTLIKNIAKIIGNETKEQRGWSLRMLFGILSAAILN